MPKSKKTSKSKAKKASQLVLRVDKAEKEAFFAACKGVDSSAGKEIRRFMRTFVATQAEATAQAEVVVAPKQVPPEAEVFASEKPESNDAAADPEKSEKPAKKRAKAASK